MAKKKAPPKKIVHICPSCEAEWYCNTSCGQGTTDAECPKCDPYMDNGGFATVFVDGSVVYPRGEAPKLVEKPAIPGVDGSWE